MAIWWSSLSVLSKILWGVTLAATLVFIIQSVLTFIGADMDSNTDFDMDASDISGDLDGGINLYTFRNFINFILGFGWTAILLKDSVKSKALLIVIAALVGIALVAIVMYLFKLLAKMQQSGTIDVYKQAVGCTGRVYLTIPGERRGDTYRRRHHQDRHPHQGCGGNQRKHPPGRRTEISNCIKIWKST